MQHRAPLVGRSHEQAVLRHVLDGAIGGHGAVALITGDGGIGKTALATATTGDAIERGYLAFTGTCFDVTEATPCGPWLDLLGRLQGHPRAPGLPDTLVRWSNGGDIGSSRTLIAEISTYLEHLASQQPLVLLFEDVHWADQESLDLLLACSRMVAALPIVLILTYRTEEIANPHPLRRILLEVIHDANPTRIHLRPLQGDDVWALVRPTYRLSARDEAALVAYLLRRGEGNPLFTRELLYSLEESGGMRRVGDRWELGNLDAAPVPGLVEHVIGERVARLGSDAQDLLAMASVIGQDVPISLWREVSGRELADVLDVTDRASAARLVQVGATGELVQFAHALIRLAIYSAIPPAQRRAWHRAVAEVLMSSGDAPPELVAYHLLYTAGESSAFDWWVKAGERAERSYGWLTAADLFERALSMVEFRKEFAGRRGWLLFRLALLRRYADPAGGIERLDTAARIGEQEADRGLVAYSRLFKGLLLCYMAELRQGLAAMDDGMAALRELSSEESDRLAVIGRELGVPSETVVGVYTMWLATVGRFQEARQYAEPMLALEPPDAAVGMLDGFNYADAYSAMMRSRAALGQPELARETYSRACALFRSVEHDSQLARVIVAGISIVILPYVADEPEERRRLADLAEATITRVGGRVQDEFPVRGTRLPVMFVEGEWAEILELATPVRAAARWQAGYMAMSAAVLGRVAYCQGDMATAQAMVQELLPNGPDTEPGNAMFFFAQDLQRLAAATALSLDDVALAGAWLEAHDRWLAWSGAIQGRASAQLSWADYFRAMGDKTEALVRVRDAVSLASNPRQPLVLLAAHRLAGELACDDGRLDEASEALGLAAALANACAAPYERALTELAVAGLQAATGRNDEALRLAHAARDTFVTLGADPSIRRAEALIATLQEAAEAEVKADTKPAAILSAREQDVLRLLSSGQTNQEIADALYLSIKTVESHITHILTKTGTRNRVAAASYAQRHNLT